MRSTHTAELNIKNIPPDAKKVCISPDLKTASLISIGQFCDEECLAHFSKENAKIIKDGRQNLFIILYFG